MKKLSLGIIAVIVGGFVALTPIIKSASVFAAEGPSCTITSVLGNKKCILVDGKAIEDANGTYNCSCDDGNGSGAKNILQLVVDIFSILVGILAVIGITVVGVQYLTSGGNEEKARKSKRRLVEIVIGIVLYVLLYALVKWLMPTK